VFASKRIILFKATTAAAPSRAAGASVPTDDNVTDYTRSQDQLTKIIGSTFQLETLFIEDPSMSLYFGRQHARAWLDQASVKQPIILYAALLRATQRPFDFQDIVE
jgi:hypothetical protein